ncbi:hypothetical protein EYF80_007101 [Liparis tanakae]|uniref:Uncharacterized protein n=1 Tax=Liparis tanakae TaxID=230148 RepID=A0A4Z2IZF5_9TELE|nr:hypothetical protein EYF80_007101 [Liparis tanakae]
MTHGKNSRKTPLPSHETVLSTLQEGIPLSSDINNIPNIRPATCNIIPHHHFKARVVSLMSNRCNGCLRDAVVVVVGRRCVREHRNEAALCGAAGTRRRRRGRRHLDVSRDGHAAALLGKEAGPIGVQVLVKLIAVHLTQKLCLTQLV